MTYADVIIDISLEKLDRSFQYAVPEALLPDVTPGTAVLVPFGRGQRMLEGFVLSLSDTPKIAPERIRPIASVVPGRVPVEGQLISLAAWMREHFGSTMNQALRTVMPSGKKGPVKKKRTVVLKAGRDEAAAALRTLTARKKHSVAKERLLRELLSEQAIPWDVITDKLSVPSAVIRDLEAKGLVTVTEERDYRDPLAALQDTGKRVTLNAQQMSCVRTVEEDMDNGKHGVYLLKGVTGSGKTEVYIELIRRTLADGKEAIVLIPEINLTYQTVMRFYSYFGKNVSILNSRMSEGERADQLDRAREGKVRIMIGPRSALFTPFRNLGLIIVDEEHESSYKSSKAPKYHARETAIERARLAGASVILGSATPSVESMAHALQGDYTLLLMNHRVMDRPLPACEIIDLRKELSEGNRSIFSRRLVELMADRLDRGEQTMLFLNRRGMNTSVSCRSCGKSIRCPHCDVPMSLHRDGRLYCHYCGHTEAMPDRCPHCGSPYIGGFGIGTEKVEAGVQRLFPGARVLRMDADTAAGKDGAQRILGKFANLEADILVGTQMIVKGHDFPAVTLMGVLCADMSLGVDSFRSAERTFELITQAAGRAGRGSRPGNVIIQTYQPEHYSIRAAAAQDYDLFYRQEIAYRKMLQYPPAGHILEILMTSESRDRVSAFADRLGTFLRRAFPGRDSGITVLGPGDDRIRKLKDLWRKTIYLKSESYDTLIAAMNGTGEFFRTAEGTSDVNLWFDFDPM